MNFLDKLIPTLFLFRRAVTSDSGLSGRLPASSHFTADWWCASPGTQVIRSPWETPTRWSGTSRPVELGVDTNRMKWHRPAWWRLKTRTGFVLNRWFKDGIRRGDRDDTSTCLTVAVHEPLRVAALRRRVYPGWIDSSRLHLLSVSVWKELLCR